MKTTGQTAAFSSPINKEHSFGLVETISQDAKSTMELFTDDGSITATGSGQIEWVYNVGTKGEDVEHIGLWWQDNSLTDYDGVFELPKQAIQLIRQAGIQVSQDFE